ncbi:hypothetical protein SK3146_03871 [Paenibacillus konkukensis]|uniref:SLH domain-containing protein n=1 Tax=Paenibacillus konkukensis TaxID=2020716 RepID=A0ABY4RQ45_9BACL|nr:S-layer homology domain-containing protein [Paenibacillus konkukensis]UQZ84616.1 hypothetical protein SK3146_03871 [Paenibacillus konkukensis]
MKKYRKQMLVVLLGGSLLSSLGTTYASGVVFNDVPNNFWGYKNIQWAIDNKVVDGYPDGTFKPNQDVHQDEFLAMLIRTFQPSDFVKADDAANWADSYLSYAKKMGWRIVPSDQVFSRGNVAQYLANATGKNYGIDDSIQYLLDLGIANGKTEKSIEGFHKNDSLTRAESVTFIERFKAKYTKLQKSPVTEEKFDRNDTQLFYRNSQYDFSLRLPKSWENKYEVVEESYDTGHNINFVNKATKYGILFTISVWSKEYWDKNESVIRGQIPVIKLGENGVHVYLFHKPTDVQYDPSDEAAKQDYEFMLEDIKGISTTFVINLNFESTIV